MSKLYSHPGKLLADHLLNVYQLGIKKFKSKELKLEEIEQIRTVAKLVLLTHDFGKATLFFQRKLELATAGEQDSQEYKELTKINSNKSSHSLLSSIFTYYLLDELVADELLPLLGMVIVAKHHGNLRNFKDMIAITDSQWHLLTEQFDNLEIEMLQEIIDKSGIEIDITELSMADFKEKLTGIKFRRKKRKLQKKLSEEQNYLITNLIYSILVATDKAEAIFYGKGLSYDRLEELVLSRRELNGKTVTEYKSIKGWEQATNKIDIKRNQIYDEVLNSIAKLDLERERILSLNVPTGTGKTLTALSAALKLRERLGAEYRLIYTLPFTSIIDQNFEVFNEVLLKTEEEVDSSLLIKHHYLTPKSYTKTGDYLDEDYDISTHLIESWNSEIIVTTFVQLLHSILSNRNRSLKKFHNLSNSIILLDEVQSIPHKYWELVRKILWELADKLNCYIIFITATMPLIYSEEEGEIKELAQSKEEHFQFFDRITLNLAEFRQEMTLDDFEHFIEKEIFDYPTDNFLIILNTIKSSLAIYKFIAEIIDNNTEIIYLSNNIIPKEREKRIKKIKEGEQRKVIISTQMVEAGVDIDLDRVYRDFAPLDSINQSCGRCNRNFNPEEKGVVTLVKLINENHHNKSYASYIYGDILLRETDRLLNELPDIVEERDFFTINNNYFRAVSRVKSDDYSLELLEKLKKLEYEEAFGWATSKAFQLIEQDFETVNLFIEVNEEARRIWESYQDINNMEIQSLADYSKRKAAFEEIKGDFLGYVITISKDVVKERLTEEELEYNFNLISQEQYQTVYDEDTGFKREEDEADFFF